nr:hypothetical protein [Tanacetum cinerariifolium]
MAFHTTPGKLTEHLMRYCPSGARPITYLTSRKDGYGFVYFSSLDDYRGALTADMSELGGRVINEKPGLFSGGRGPCVLPDVGAA